MKVLVLTEDRVLSDVLALAVESVSDAQCLSMHSEQELYSTIEDSAADFVCVLDVRVDAEAMQGKLSARGFPCIRIIEEGDPLALADDAKQLVISKPIELQDLVNLVVKSIGYGETASDYYRVRISSLLLTGDSNQFDIFIKLSEKKFVCVIHGGDSFDDAAYQKYLNKGLSHLYIRKNDFNNWVSSVVIKLGNVVIGSEPATLEGSLNVFGQMHGLMREMLPEMGFAPPLQQVAKVTVDLAVSAIRSNPKIEDLLKRFLENEEHYHAWHSTALAFLSVKLAAMLKWDNQNTHFKLSLASLLHDIAVENPDWAEAGTEGEMMKLGVPREKWDSYKKHPLVAAELAKEMKDFPGDVDHIIAQHHEMPDSSGFPLGVGHTRISEISALFIIAHGLVRSLHKHRAKFDMALSLGVLAQTYNMGVFKKIVDDLDKAIKLEKFNQS